MRKDGHQKMRQERKRGKKERKWKGVKIERRTCQ